MTDDLHKRAEEIVGAIDPEDGLGRAVFCVQMAPHWLAVVRAINKVKANQHGPQFWQCECGALEELDDAMAAYEAALAKELGP